MSAFKSMHFQNFCKNYCCRTNEGTTLKKVPNESCCFLLLYVPSQQLWSSPDVQFTKPHFFLGKLKRAVNQYFLHKLSLVTDNNPSWMIQQKGGEWHKGLFHDQSPRKYGTGRGSNSRPLDLQSDSQVLPDTLPTVLHGPVPNESKLI